MLQKIIFTILSLLFIFTVAFSVPAEAGRGPSLAEGKKLYKLYCTACHGIKGDGNGFNAENLDPRPVNHTDNDFMSKKTDSELLNAISGGGKAVGKSTLMPPWGNTLDELRIKSLILYLRKICNCKGG